LKKDGFFGYIVTKKSFIQFPSGRKFHRKNFNNAPDKKASVIVSGKLFRDNLVFVIKRRSVCPSFINEEEKVL
jgi:hypothetical protein